MLHLSPALRSAIFGAGAIALLPAGALAGPAQNAHAEWMTGYMDTNDDGVVDIDEARAASEMHFDRIAGGKSEITQDDYVNWRPGLAKLNDKTKNWREGYFGSIDTANAGVLTKEEYVAHSVEEFMSFDEDDDGHVDSGELETYRRDL